MKKFMRFIRKMFYAFGIDLKRVVLAIGSIPYYIRCYVALKEKAKTSGNEFPIKSIYPCLTDRFESSGTASGHYFFQDLLVAQKVFAHNPEKHVDIGSSIEGFVAHVAAFRKVEVFDIRSLESHVENIKFTQADLMAPDFNLVNYADSISCLHAIEHFGLGRYGDPINYNGHLDGLKNMYKIVKKGGKFYFSTPIGPQRIEFNAHRVFSIRYLLSVFAGEYRLDSFSYVNDADMLVKDPPMNEANIDSNFGCTYGCGIFEFTKL